MYFSPLPFFLYGFKTHRDESKIVNDDDSKRSSKRFSSFFSFFLSCETEVRPSRIERSRRLGKQKLGQDLPQRGTKGRAARKAARNRRNSSVRLTLVFLLFPHSLLLWRPTMMNNAATPKDSQKAVVRFVGGKIWIPSFRSNPHPPPSRTFSVHLPLPSLSRLFSSFSKRASERDLSELGTINVCLKFPGSSAAMINASHSTARPSASMKNNLFRLRARILCYAPRNFHPPWNSS